MALALAQQQNTPSSFSDNWGGNNSFFPFPQIAESSKKYSDVTFFIDDNQWSKKLIVPIIEQPSRIISFDKLIEQEEYKGFSLEEWGDILLSYSNDGYDFLGNLKYVCLNRQIHNGFYPDPYLFICFELELEGVGKTKEEALNNLYHLLDIYFTRTREICENPEEYTSVISNNINRQSPWKQSFLRTYQSAQKLELNNAEHKHRVV